MKSSFLESPQVLVVEASAGSGKTYELARRYVQLSLYLAARQSRDFSALGLRMTAIQSILAITFTNKAAWAMKSRILDFLKRIALQQLKLFEVRDILEPLGLDSAAASPLAFAVMNDVIRQYHYFGVQTIDSFINVLLSGCSFKIGLSARFKIQRNSKEYLQLSLDELLEEADHDISLRRAFEDFVRQYLFLENRWGWFPKEDLLLVISELFRQYNTYQKAFLVSPSDEDSLSRKKRIYALMQELKNICPPETKKNLLDHLEELVDCQKGVFDVDQLNACWAKEDFPMNKGGTISPSLEKLWLKLRGEIHDLCLWEAQSMFDPYVVLFGRLLSCFGRLSQRDDVLFLEELNRRAASLFEDGLVTVEELYFRLAARFEHYLIDEFQDTSLSQWRNLSTMVEEALAHGGSLFYVGDKKQAIYAFRGGESRLFDALQSQLAHFNVKVRSLDHNYRSYEQIIRFNNRVFSLDNLRGFLDRRLQDSKGSKRHKDIHFSESEFASIADTFANAQQLPGKDLAGGVVRVVHLQGRVKQERALELRGQLTALVADLRRRFSLKDIAVLTRGNEEVEEITQWLLQEGLWAQSERTSDIKNNPLIAELIDLLTFLASPTDNNAFAQFCLGELLPKATGLAPEVLRDFLFDCALLSKQNKAVCFYKHFRDIFPAAWESFFEESLGQAGIYPLYELTAAIIGRLGLEKHFPGSLGFFMHFLELVKRQESQSCDLSYFLDYYEKLEGEERFVPMADVDALRVLTVHKAKGLEFPVVIVPYFEMDIKASSGGRDGSQAYILDIKQEGMGLLRLKESYRQFCPQLQDRYEQEYKKAFLIELNTAYVALTRAIEELYIFVPSKVGNSVNPARFLIPEECLGTGTPRQRLASHVPQETRWKIKPFKFSGWKGLREEFLDRPARSADRARKGEFYHAVLMFIRSLSDSNAEAAIKEAWNCSCQLIPRPCGEDKEGESAIAQILSFINRQDVRRFFYLPADAEVLCEKEFVNACGDTKRIDRLIVLKDEVWIVDYKLSGAASGEHQKQMEGYIELVRQFYPKYKISGHVLYLQDQ
ncbi:MAG: UvrD-helicase domain-containing protein [Candidatus Omnitrophica bacterium]|nr:UvrD-helicase domain-containing protein [Candidatus Omnitrophota bacterium]